MNDPKVLSEEEWKLIGEHRYAKTHNKHMVKITLVCYFIAVLTSVILWKYGSGNMYVIGLFPAAFPLFWTMRNGNKKTKAGEEFANEVLKDPRSASN